MSTPEIVARVGTTPAQRGSTNDLNCPAVFELDDDRIGCIGTDLTEQLRDKLPPGASIGENERLVALPFSVLLDAIPDIVRHVSARYVPTHAGGCGPIAGPGPENDPA
jgi:hypothetical protein